MSPARLREERLWTERMTAARAGDEAAYRRLLNDAAQVAATVARRVARGSGLTTADIQDIAQETLLAIHINRARWRSGSRVRPWIAAIAHNKTIDAIRAQRGRYGERVEDWQDRLAAPPTDPSAPIDVARLVRTLRPRQRALVEDVMLRGCTIAEVAERLDISAVAGRVTLYRAMRALSANVRSERPGSAPTS